MKKMMTLLALACLSLNTQTSEWGKMAHKPLPNGPRQQTYPQDELHALQQGMHRKRSVSDIAQQFGGSAKGTLRRAVKPANLPPQTEQQQTDFPTQPSAPQPPAYHEWLPLSPTSPSSQDSYRSSSACSDQGLEARTASYTEEPPAGWVSQQPRPRSFTGSSVNPRTIPGQEFLPPDVQQQLAKAWTEFDTLEQLRNILTKRIIQTGQHCVDLAQQTPPPVKKRIGESTAHADSRGQKALNDKRQQALTALTALTQAIHVTNKTLTKATTK